MLLQKSSLVIGANHQGSCTHGTPQAYLLQKAFGAAASRKAVTTGEAIVWTLGTG